VTGFRIGHAAAADWQAAAQVCLAQLDASGSGGNLGFLYVTDFFADALPEIHRLFVEVTGVAHWVGTVGIGICATGVEYLDEPAIVAMIGDFPPGSFRVFGAVSGAEQIQSAELQCGDAAPGIAVVHADPLAGDIEKQLRLLAKRMESGFLMGGLAS